MDVEKCAFLPSLDQGLADHDHWFQYQTALPSREIMTKVLADGLFSCCAIGTYNPDVDRGCGGIVSLVKRNPVFLKSKNPPVFVK
jgi:hypothetical protein